MRTGGRYVRHAPLLRAVLAQTALFMIFGSAVWALLPVVARGPLQLGVGGYGLLLGGAGVGAVLGALVVPMVRTRVGPGVVVAASTLAYAAAVLVTGATRAVPLVAVAMVVTGIGWVTVMSVSGRNTTARPESAPSVPVRYVTSTAPFNGTATVYPAAYPAASAGSRTCVAWSHRILRTPTGWGVASDDGTSTHDDLLGFVHGLSSASNSDAVIRRKVGRPEHPSVLVILRRARPRVPSRRHQVGSVNSSRQHSFGSGLRSPSTSRSEGGRCRSHGRAEATTAVRWAPRPATPRRRQRQRVAVRSATGRCRRPRPVDGDLLEQHLEQVEPALPVPGRRVRDIGVDDPE
ncbi:MFS transporter [Pseudonocardia aurantiaca]|uniref:MFS transporter n=1 Tax=Pseudonocardia aurantiaca TaxID=75290 RepID=A0ABW4FLS0_9PSEU